MICGHGNIEITVQLGATAPGANILEQAMSTQDVLKHGWCLLRETEHNVSIEMKYLPMPQSSLYKDTLLQLKGLVRPIYRGHVSATSRIYE